MKPYLSVLSFALALAVTCIASAQLPDGVTSDLGPGVPEGMKVRPGYRVTRALAEKDSKGDLRFLELSDDGQTLFLSQREQGAILALRDPDADGVYQTVTTFVKNRRGAHGMDVHDGWLYFSQAVEGAVSRARDTNGDFIADEVEYVCPPKSIPGGGGHNYGALLVTADRILITSSDPQNMTPELDSPRKTIYAFDLDGRNKRVFATGIRNNEKLRFRPGTTEVWGFDHGSDNFGKTFGEQTSKHQPITDLNPPEELNRYVEGGFYGHPYLVGRRIPRPEFAERDDIIELAAKTIVPEWLLGAHWAINGFTFLEKDHFGADHSGDIVFASHGSWNAIKPVGAVVGRVLFDDLTGKPYGQLTLVDCQGEKRRVARPVDCLEAPDGTILFTSDEPPALYRISRSTRAGEATGPATRPQASARAPVDAFRALAAAGGDKIVLLDVRTPREFAQGHLAGAVNIDSSAPDFAQRLAALDRDKTYLIYCRTGRRSTQARTALEQLGFPASRLVTLEGGILAWEKAGEPLAK